MLKKNCCNLVHPLDVIIAFIIDIVWYSIWYTIFATYQLSLLFT